MKLYSAPKTRLVYPESIDEDHPEGMAVEIGDEVEFTVDGDWGNETNEGEITAILPKKGAAKVVYLDGHDVTKAGEPRRKVILAAISGLTLIARSM